MEPFYNFIPVLSLLSSSSKMFDPLKVFSVPFKILKLFGLWQRKTSSKPYRIYGFTMHLVFFTMFTLFHVFYIFNFKDLRELSDCMSTFLTNFALLFKTINFMLKIEKILQLVEELKLIVKFCENRKQSNEHVKKLVKEGWMTFKIFCSFAIISCSFAGLVPFFDIKEHKLPYKMHFPYLDYENNDSVFIILAIYELTPALTCSITTSLDTLPVFFMCFAAGMLEDLNVRLSLIGSKYTVEEITDNPKLIDDAKDRNKDLNNLLECIEMHQKIMKIVSDTQKYFATVIMIQGAMSSIIFCSTAFMLSTVSLREKY